MRVKLFTHTDLDGVGCAVLALSVFGSISGRENVDVEYCDYKDIDEKVRTFLECNGNADYDEVFRYERENE